MGFFVQDDAVVPARIPEPHTRFWELSGHGHRYYIPVIGRWVSRDPIEEYGGVSVYGLVGNGQINRYDLFGLASEEDCVCCCADDIIIDLKYGGALQLGIIVAAETWKVKGHKFDATFKTASGTGTGKHCLYDWYEYVLPPPDSNMGGSGLNPGEGGIQDYGTLPPDTSWTHAEDYPYIPVAQQPSSGGSWQPIIPSPKRKFMILLTLTSSSSCECDKSQVQVAIEQKLEVTGMDISASYFNWVKTSE